MKKVLALMAIAAVTFLSCNKDEDDNGNSGGGNATLTVEKKNHALLIDFSEDWCPPCGSNGGPTFDSLLYYEGDILNAMKVYNSSNNADLNCAMGNSLWAIYNTQPYGGNGVPKFIVGNQYQGLSSNVNSNVSLALSKAASFNNDSVIAGVALAKLIEGDSIKVRTKVQFFKDQLVGTDIRLAIYVVEGPIVSTQEVSYTAPADPNYEHFNLLRTSNDANYAGVKINDSQAIVVDQVFENTYTMYLDPSWDKNNIKVVAAIWKMNSNPPKVINSNIAK